MRIHPKGVSMSDATWIVGRVSRSMKNIYNELLCE